MRLEKVRQYGTFWPTFFFLLPPLHLASPLLLIYSHEKPTSKAHVRSLLFIPRAVAPGSEVRPSGSPGGLMADEEEDGVDEEVIARLARWRGAT